MGEQVRVVVVTGSRYWTNGATIRAALAPAQWVIVGDCPTGADYLATAIAQKEGLHLDIHHAAWGAHGRSAGPIRNKQMALRALIEQNTYHNKVSCCAFMCRDKPNKGTMSCIKEMEKVGIAVTRFWDK